MHTKFNISLYKKRKKTEILFEACVHVYTTRVDICERFPCIKSACVYRYKIVSYYQMDRSINSFNNYMTSFHLRGVLLTITFPLSNFNILILNTQQNITLIA